MRSPSSFVDLIHVTTIANMLQHDSILQELHLFGNYIDLIESTKLLQRNNAKPLRLIQEEMPAGQQEYQ